MADGTIRIDTKIDQSDLPKQLGQLETNVKKSTVNITKLFGVALAGIGAAFGAVTLAAKKFAETTDRIDKMSQSIGISRKTFQEWDYIMGQNGASIESLEMGMKTLVDQITNTSTAADKNSTALGKLGISVTDVNGNLKDQETVFNEVVSALQAMPQGTQKAALANELLGRSATELMPLLNQTAEGTEALRKNAYDLGIVLSDQAVTAGVAFVDALDDLKKAGSGFLNNVVAPLIPLLVDLITRFTKFATEGDNLKNIIKGIVSAGLLIFVTSTALAIPGLIAQITALKTAVMAFNTTALFGPTGIIIGLAALVAALVAVGNAVHQSALKEIANEFGNLATEANMSTEKIYKVQEAIANASKGAGTFEEIRDQVKQFSEDLGISESQVIAIGLASQKVTDEYKATLRAVKDYNDQLAISQSFIVGTPEWIAKQKREQEALAAAKKEEAASGKTLSDAELEQIKQRITAQKEYEHELESIKQLVAGSFITQEDGATMANDAARKYAETLIDIGYKFGDLGTIGGKALASLSEMLKPKEITLISPKSLERNLSNSLLIVDGIKKTLWQKMYETGKGIVTNVSDAVYNFGSRATKSIKTFISGMGNAIIFAGGIFKTAFSIISKLAALDPGALVASLDEFLGAVTNFFMVTLPNLPYYLDSAVAIINSFLDGITSNLPHILETFSNVISSAVNLIIEHAPDFIESAGAIIIALIQGIADNAPKIIDAVMLIISTFDKFINSNLADIIMIGGEIIVGLIQGLTETMPLLIQNLVDNFPAILDAIITIFPQIVKAITDSIVPITLAIAEATPYIIAAIIAALPEIIVAVIEMAWDIGRGLFDGLVAAISGIFKGIGGVFKKYLLDPILNFFGIHSPSTVFADIGVNLINGLINGILDAGSGIWDAVSGVFTGLLDGISSLFESGLDIGSNLISSITDGVSSALGSADKASGGMISAFGTTIGNTVSTIGNTVGNTVSKTAKKVGNSVSKATKKVKKFFGFASGTDSAPAGLALVGEDGPELVQLSGGERIYPASETKSILNSGLSSILNGISSFSSPSFPSMSGGGTYQIVIKNDLRNIIDGKEVGRSVFENIDSFVKGATS